MIITTQTTREALEKLSPACKCKACEIGCHYGSGVLDDDDYQKIADHFSISLEELKQRYLVEVEKFHTKRHQPKIQKEQGKPYGKCIFFEKGCAIHDVKPMECRVASGCNGHGETINQWVLFHSFVNPADPQSLRAWSLWLHHHKPIPGASMEEIIPDKKQREKIIKEVP
ncbi:hypothetical protein J4410_05760 [Candidatus Woesearchaeota archaeon]|nr:hypothetical protein [Candidatus Woesearchaeota archaeon]